MKRPSGSGRIEGQKEGTIGYASIFKEYKHFARSKNLEDHLDMDRDDE